MMCSSVQIAVERTGFRVKHPDTVAATLNLHTQKTTPCSKRTKHMTLHVDSQSLPFLPSISWKSTLASDALTE